jgi:hypothetical protein
MTTRIAPLLLSLLIAPACTGSLETLPPLDDGGGENPGGDGPLCTVEARSYVGLGGFPLEGGRIEAVAYADRVRLKPFGSMAGEYLRVLGAEVNTAPYAATFGAPPARWFEEPQASATTLFATFALSFDACNAHTASGDRFAAAPTAEMADALCRDFARRFWDRDASDEQASACATYALATDASDPPRRRWAHACAAVLSSAGFLAY